jgi:hypothetical protein
MNCHHGDDNSQSVNEFHGLMLPEPGKPVGYAALIDNFGLRVPFPLTTDDDQRPTRPNLDRRLANSHATT